MVALACKSVVGSERDQAALGSVLDLSRVEQHWLTSIAWVCPSWDRCVSLLILGIFILHKGTLSLSQRSHLHPPGLRRRAQRFFFFCLISLPPFFFFEWGWGRNTRIEPKPQFLQRVLERKKQSRRGRRCHLKADPARGSQPSPAEGGGSAATEATSADPGRRPRTCGADCSCPWAVQPGTRWLEGGRSAGSWSPAPTGSP